MIWKIAKILFEIAKIFCDVTKLFCIFAVVFYAVKIKFSEIKRILYGECKLFSESEKMIRDLIFIRFDIELMKKILIFAT